jgi:thiol-disulfide isomerase/thioredoxin
VKRRGLVLAGVAAAAALSGAGWSMWRGRAQPAAAEAEPASSLWGLRFAQPDGGELAMATLRGHPLVLNFWATWCPPCVKEMPELDRFHRAFKARGWQVVGLAIDQPDPVRAFLGRTPVQFPIGLAGLAGMELTRQLGNQAGALPFSVMFDAAGKPVHQKLGETNYDELSAWAQALS